MPWFKVDDGFHGHPKVVDVPMGAVGLWAMAGSWCAKYLTDGAVPEKTVIRLGGTLEQAADLVGSGLWFATGDGFCFKDWADYQPSKESILAERAAAQDRMAKVRAAKKGVRPNIDRTTGERSDEQLANVRDVFARSSENVRVAPSHPIPSLSQSLPIEETGKRPSVRMPKDWAPTAAHFERAKEQRLDIAREVESFKGHAETHDRHAANWNAAFTTWLGKATPSPIRKGSTVAELQAHRAKVEAELEAQHANR